jgi:hypothetical protein
VVIVVRMVVGIALMGFGRGDLFAFRINIYENYFPILLQYNGIKYYFWRDKINYSYGSYV